MNEQIKRSYLLLIIYFDLCIKEAEELCIRFHTILLNTIEDERIIRTFIAPLQKVNNQAKRNSYHLPTIITGALNIILLPIRWNKSLGIWEFMRSEKILNNFF
jgi:hypothetical protein